MLAEEWRKLFLRPRLGDKQEGGQGWQGRRCKGLEHAWMLGPLFQKGVSMVYSEMVRASYILVRVNMRSTLGTVLEGLFRPSRARRDFFPAMDQRTDTRVLLADKFQEGLRVLVHALCTPPHRRRARRHLRVLYYGPYSSAITPTPSSSSLHFCTMLTMTYRNHQPID